MGGSWTEIGHAADLDLDSQLRGLACLGDRELENDLRLATRGRTTTSVELGAVA